jgi:hypothetical protein
VLWRKLLDMPMVVLCCFCGDERRCHRSLVRRNLVRAGAVDGGEICVKEAA